MALIALNICIFILKVYTAVLLSTFYYSTYSAILSIFRVIKHMISLNLQYPWFKLGLPIKSNKFGYNIMYAFSFWHTYYDSAFTSHHFKIPNIFYSEYCLHKIAFKSQFRPENGPFCLLCHNCRNCFSFWRRQYW